MLISISIVTYNNERTIDSALDSLFDYLPTDDQFVIYIIDNGSSDNTTSLVASHIEQYAQRPELALVLIPSPNGNIGFGAAHNLVLSRLNSQYHMIMNPDIVFKDHHTLPRLIQFGESHPGAGLMSPSVLSPGGEIQYLCRRDPTFIDLIIRFLPGRLLIQRQRWHTMQDQDYQQPFLVPFASGCCMMIRTSLFQNLHGFDERFFLYLEDADLSRRINQTSQVWFVPDSVVYHEWERASYKNPRLTLIHLQSFWRYFRKWGFRWI